MPGKIQNEDVKSSAELAAAGGTDAQLINDTKIYVTAGSLNKTLSAAITAGDIGGSGGAINYITNSRAEADTSGWATYSNTASNIPTTGTGGTATGLTFSRSTSSPLRDTASFLMAQTNSTNIQGKGVSYDFTIASADQAKLLKVSLDYNASSTMVVSDGKTPPLNDGTTSTNAGNSDVEFFIYDKTNANLISITPQVLTAKGSNNFNFSGVFQTASNSTSYRLIIHVATSNANATGWNFKFDNVSVGPQALVTGYSASDWTAFTPTGTWTTNTTYTGFYKISGDTLEMQVKLLMSGTPSSGTLKVNLPPGFVIDTNKVAQFDVEGTNPQNVNLGLLTAVDRATQTYAGYIAYINTTQVECQFAGVSGSLGLASGIINPTAPFSFGNLDNISFHCKVPIIGLSSNVLMSNNAASRLVAARFLMSTNKSVSTTQPADFDTLLLDTHGAVTTGSSWKFTAPVSGTYNISWLGYHTSNSAREVRIYKNGSYYALLGVTQAIAAVSQASNTIDLIAGDSIDFRCNTSDTLQGAALNAGGAWISIFQVQGPSSIVTLEKIQCKYTGATTSISNGATVEVVNPTKVWDTHGAYNPSTGRFTAPRSDYYEVKGTIYGTGFTGGSGAQIGLLAGKNGSSAETLQRLPYVNTTNPSINVTFDIYLLAGETTSLFAYLSDGTTRSLAGGIDNWISISSK